MEPKPDPSLMASVQALAQHVSLKQLQLSDVDSIINYWYQAPPEYVERLGGDLKKFPSHTVMRSGLEERVQHLQNDPLYKSPTLIICYDNKRIGYHSLTHINDPRKLFCIISGCSVS